MDCRELLKKGQITVFIDSKSFSDQLNRGNNKALAILKFNMSKEIDLIRTPFRTTHEELKKIPDYEIIKEADKIKSLKIIRKMNLLGEESIGQYGFFYRMTDIQQIAEHIYQSDNLTEIQFNKILLIFFQAVFSRSDDKNIFVTNESILLKNRLWFESHFPGGKLNIFSIDEAIGYLDIFLKYNEEYRASGYFNLNKGYWYLLSSRLKLPHYNVGSTYIDSLNNRFQYLLMSVDEIGLQYYQGANNDTMDNTMYHFNYSISLLTGIFDNLALHTNDSLGINFTPKIRISLSNGNGRDFLREVRRINPAIREHIQNHVNLIKLIYSLREIVIHREGLQQSGFEYHGEDDIKWEANFIKINADIHEAIKRCRDSPEKYGYLSKWGVYTIHTDIFLEPYRFLKNAVKHLIPFIDKYFELLGFNNFIENQKRKKDRFTETLVRFEADHLGF
jgi:hypothetical protein